MLIYTVRRLLVAIPVLLAASTFTFFLVEIAPGGPLDSLLQRQPPVPQAVIQAHTERLYLDHSLLERYWMWLTGLGDNNGDIGILQGKWGPTLTGADIGEQLGERVIITLRLVLAAAVLSVLMGMVTGVISAVRQYSKTDYALTFLGFLGLAMPTFWIAAFMKEFGVQFNKITGTDFFFTIAATSPGYDRMDFLEKVGDVAGHLVLPTATLMLTGYAAVSRFQRGAMLEVLNSDYVRLARAKGLRYGVVMRRHALRTALIPVATVAAPLVATSVSGAVITETVFRWRGMGLYLLDSVREGESFTVMAIILVLGSMVVIGNLVADLLYAVLDPRIRYE
jgi:peptide/nickel transport system permease protein